MNHSDSADDDFGVTVDREAAVLCGFIEHLLPKVGSHVRTLDLAHGKAVSNEVVSPCNQLYLEIQVSYKHNNCLIVLISLYNEMLISV